MTLMLIVLLPLLGAIIALPSERLGRTQCSILTALAPTAALVLLVRHLPEILSGQVLVSYVSWLPAMGLDFEFRLDGLSAMFAALILGIGLLIVLYARYYLKPHDSLGKLYSLLCVFMTAMLGIVMANNLLLLVLFWELTSLTSFLLISYWPGKQDARRGARMALTVTGAGGLAMLAGFLILGNIVGSYQISEVLSKGAEIRAHALYPVALVLILAGAFTKSAQFPMHFWLPNAMDAPTPVSAYLHSATMVKAGVFLLARLYPVLAGTDLWFFLVASTGIVTMVFGAGTALFKHDIKGLLAYSTISHLGLITFLFGLNTPLAAVAALFHIVNHATFKASLFMATGVIDHETGTRDMRKLNGMLRFMPHTAILAIVAAAAMAGVPLLNGFLSKEMFYDQALHAQKSDWVNVTLPILATIGGLFSVAYSVRFIHDVFFNGKPIDLPIYPPKPPPRYMVIPIEVLVFLCLLVGILPNFTVAPILKAATLVVVGGEPPEYHIAIWHGLNVPLMMSGLAFIGGIALYSQRRRLFSFYDSRAHIDMKPLFDRGVKALMRASARVTTLLENGSLQRYITFLLGFTVLLGGTQLLAIESLTGPVALSRLDPVTAVLGLIAMASAVSTAVMHHNRFAALLSLSVVGLMVALLFVRFSAPDLALTQLSVEVVTIVLMMLALYFLPQLTPSESSNVRVARDLLLAGASGLGVGVLAWAVLTRDFEPISSWFIANSVSGGGGTNVVNVILVDFRGFDTLGEITVLAIAAVGIQQLLNDLRLPIPTTNGQIGWDKEPHPPILAVMAKVLLPLALLVSAYIFMRGHNLPGGGFIAGLVTSVAIILQYLANGTDWVQERLGWEFRRTAAAGVLLAAVTGLVSLAFGSPFLTSAFTHLHWPLVGEFEIASALAFDAGVYLAVVGATLLILAKLGILGQVSAYTPAAEVR